MLESEFYIGTNMSVNQTDVRQHNLQQRVVDVPVKVIGSLRDYLIESRKDPFQKVKIELAYTKYAKNGRDPAHFMTEIGITKEEVLGFKKKYGEDIFTREVSGL